MGYLIKSGDGSTRHSTVRVTDEVWMELIKHASEGGYSAPPYLRMLELRNVLVHIDDDEAEDLEDALSTALRTTLKDAPVVDPDPCSGQLDRVTVHRVTHVLRSGDVSLARTPRWQAGD
jgi:hypothetical protein